MPKKMGENSKSVQARERKKLAKLFAEEKAMKDTEDQFWQDENKLVVKKQKRKEDEERKKFEHAKKKAEARALLEQEMASVKSNAKQCVKKTTRHEIHFEMDQRKTKAARTKDIVPQKVVKQDLMQENLNRAMSDVVVATNIDEAIAALNIRESEDDKHPEKRMKAAFKAFQQDHLQRIKLENPTLRMSQWNQILMKEWNKSSQNPMNHNFQV